jgi:hypothetical protein
MSAQSKEPSPSEIFSMERRALGMLSLVPYRSTMTGETFPARGQEANWKTVLIREIIAPDRYREVQENTTQGKSDRRELIAVSGKYYQRFDNDPWREYPPRSDYVAPKNEASPAIASKPKIESQARLLETLTENGRLVSVYEVKSKVTREIDGKEVTQLTTSRFWFRDDGMLLKEFKELETSGNPRIVSNTTVYEYDDIKIEAPILQ